MQHPNLQRPVESAFSPAGLEALRSLDLQRKGEVVLKVLHLFQTTLDRNSVEIAQAVGQEDWRALKSVAHGLKGASYNVGAMKLGDCCRQLETVAALAMSHQLAARMSDFNAELSRVRAELRMLLSS